jgi:hypothetical protein
MRQAAWATIQALAAPALVACGARVTETPSDDDGSSGSGASGGATTNGAAPQPNCRM